MIDLMVDMEQELVVEAHNWNEVAETGKEPEEQVAAL
jgi:hypothetical protein